MLKVHNKQRNRIATVLNHLSATAKSSGGLDRIINKNGLTTSRLIALESADDENVRHGLKTARQSIRQEFLSAFKLALESEDGETIEGNDEAGVEDGIGAELTEAQLQAGAITAAALENPVEYAEYATKVNVANAQDSDPLSSGAFSSGAIADKALAQEAYDAPTLHENAVYSMVYNVFAARQSPLQELFYPTITLTADSNGVAVYTRYQVYFNNFQHKNDGTVTDGRVPLYQAVNDPSILFNEITRVYPVYDDSDANVVSKFAPGFTPKPVTVDGVSFETAPLAVGVEIGLIGLSQAAVAGFTGEMGSEDQIANGARLKNIYLDVVNKDNVKSTIMVNLRTLGRTAYLPSPEGSEMDVFLNFLNKQLPLSKDTVDITGAPAAALDFLRTPTYEDNVLHYSINVTSNLNLETGLVTVNNSVGQLAQYALRVTAANVAVREVDAVKVTELRSNIKSITLVGWDPDMQRTNLNLRQRGPLCGTTEKHERYIVRMNAPVAAIAPTTETRTTSDFVAPITAIRIRNDNDAITHLFANHEALMAHTASYDNSLPRPDIKALGRHVITPFADHIEANVLDLITTTRSKYVNEDFRWAVGNLIREVIFRGLRKSLYETSLRIQTGVDGAKPTIIIGTNPVLAKHLNVKETAEWLGDNFPYDVVIESHEDRRLGGLEDNVHEIFIGLSIPGSQWSPHNNGHFLYIPELVSTLKTMRNGSMSNELIVMSRCEHITLCPWSVRISLTGVSEAFTTKIPYAFTF